MDQCRKTHVQYFLGMEGLLLLSPHWSLARHCSRAGPSPGGLARLPIMTCPARQMGHTVLNWEMLLHPKPWHAPPKGFASSPMISIEFRLQFLPDTKSCFAFTSMNAAHTHRHH